MIEIGLADPFIKVIVGMVVIATAASFVLSILGDGTKAALAVGLSLMFGVILAVLRVLMNNLDGAFVRVLCLGASAVIVCVFLVFVLVAVPAVTVCWPRSYSETLGLKGCAVVSGPKDPPFQPIPYDGVGISANPVNKRYVVLVFYRPERLGDAERIVGALHSASYNADAQESNLNEVISADRDPGTTVVKLSNTSRPLAEEIGRVTKLAIPIRAPAVTIFPQDAVFTRGDVQIDLF